MSDTDKTKAQLIAELVQMREHIANLESSEAERKNALVSSKAQLAETQQVAKLGSWNLDLVVQKLHWSDETYRLFDKNMNEFTPIFDEFARLVHPDDLTTMINNFNLSIESDDNPYHVTLRIINDSKREWIMEAHGIVKRNAQHEPLSIFGTAQDVTERVLTQSRLIEAERKSAAASRAKSAFLAHMSHEIRTPMNGIIGTADLLLEMEEDDERYKYVQIIKQSGSTLISILNDILDVSKIEAGQLQLDLQDFALKELLNGISAMFEFELNKKQLSLLYDINADVPDIIVSDPNRLRQILVNLIGNAAKFSHKKGKIQLYISTKENDSGTTKDHLCLQFKVTDSGIGIPKKQQEKIFDPFVQADNSVTRKFGGTGLGLQICKQLCQLLGGEIHIENSDNTGTTLVFYIQVKLGQTIKSPPTQCTYSRKSAQDTKLLLAEDNLVNQQVAHALLRRLGYTTKIVSNGKEAIEEALTSDYDIILMDCHMPILDGYEATRRLREKEQFKNIPIIAMTASASKEERKLCKKIGMSDFIAKPIDLHSIKATLSRWH